jgi:type I restriction enzyme S subunit
MTLADTVPFSGMRSAASAFSKGEVLYSRLRPYLNKVWVAEFNGACSGELLALRPNQELDARYLAYLLHGARFVQYASHAVTGDRPRIDFDEIARFEVPLPPIDAQSSIIARIDALFAEIDEGERALAAAREGVETYRKSLLKAAVTGELTADWRRANPPPETGHDLLGRILADRRIKRDASSTRPTMRRNEPIEPPSNDLPGLPKDWTWVTLGEVFHVFVGATPPRGDAALWDGTVPWVSSGEVAFCRIRETRESIAVTAVAADRIHPPGTVLLGMIGEGRTRGQAAILDIAAAHNQNCASIRVSETPIPPEYVFEYLVERYQETRTEGAGGNQPALNKARVQAMPMPFPPLSEMKEIVRLLSAARLRQDDVADILAEAGINSRDLRQSILAAAFRGDLVS